MENWIWINCGRGVWKKKTNALKHTFCVSGKRNRPYINYCCPKVRQCSGAQCSDAKISSFVAYTATRCGCDCFVLFLSLHHSLSQFLFQSQQITLIKHKLVTRHHRKWLHPKTNGQHIMIIWNWILHSNATMRFTCAAFLPYTLASGNSIMSRRRTKEEKKTTHAIFYVGISSLLSFWYQFVLHPNDWFPKLILIKC